MEHSGNVVVNLKKMIELNGALMNGSRVRVGEGRFITFVFFFINKKGDSIENNKIKGYKSTLTTPHP